MLEQGTWLPQAAALPPGRRARVDHYCGPGRTLLIRHDNDGQLHAWCFRCNDGGRHRRQQSLSELVAHARTLHASDDAARVDTAKCGRLPAPSTDALDDWPVAARLWLYRAGLGKAEARDLGAYHHTPTQRVVLPVPEFRTGRVRYWQARAYQPGRQPKYLGPENRPRDLVPGFVGRSAQLRGDHARPVVLTEDILSAYKVSLAGFDAWPVMGTSIPAAYVSALLQSPRPVRTWLDPDAAGRRAAAKYVAQLRAYDIDVRDVLSSRDPKLHFLDDILEYLR